MIVCAAIDRSGSPRAWRKSALWSRRFARLVSDHPNRRNYRKLEDEARALADARTFNGQATAELFGGQRATMQAEAVAFLSRGKTVRKDPSEVFRSDPDAIVDHRNLN